MSDPYLQNPNPTYCSSVPGVMSQKTLICIVDDNQCFRDALEALIISMGYDVAAFGSAEDYLSSALVTQTSCLISDWQMPGMNGAELQDRLITGGHHIPIIFVTAVCTETERARVLKAGAISVLDKPFEVGALIACLHKAFGSVGRG
ncbi:MAG TPA: response regulator [Xanthobacteraceae bacterium]|nr:response regulator [Xanthobacteraceae bacterium]